MGTISNGKDAITQGISNGIDNVKDAAQSVQNTLDTVKDVTQGVINVIKPG